MKLNIQHWDRFNKWTVICEAEIGVRNTRYFVCRCECGKIKNVALCHLNSKKNPSKSCWCMWWRYEARIASITKHSMTNTPTYRTWMSMKQRCMNKNQTAYPWYGGRWITVCDRWRDSFENFYADMWLRPDWKTLDRIDVNWNYEPHNCKWSTRSQQSRNTRKTKFFEWKKVTDIWDDIWMPYIWLYDKLWKYSMESIELIKRYWPHAVVKKDLSWDIIKIYKDAKTAWLENKIASWSISKCCRKHINNITAWWFLWDFLLKEKVIPETREIKSRKRKIPFELFWSLDEVDIVQYELESEYKPLLIYEVHRK